MVDDEMSVVILTISRFIGAAHFFEVAHRGMVCVRGFIYRGECKLVYVNVNVSNRVSQKREKVGNSLIR